jgi:tetratricopeptide (TPR) repeat protein
LRHGWQLHQQRRYAEAENAYRRVLVEQPELPAALYCFGRLAFDTANYDLAADYLSRAAEADPSKSQYHADLGLLFQSLGRLDEAVASYRRALSLEPDRGDVHVNLGNTLLKAGEPTQAMTCYRRALECEPKLADAHSCLGAVLEQEGRVEDAIACYRRAIELRPDYAAAHFNLGTVLSIRGEYSAAREHLEKAVEHSPRFAQAQNNLGVVLSALFDLPRAQQCYERALELAPGEAKTHFSLGDVLEAQGLVEAALLRYDEAIRLNPEFEQAHLARGKALLKLGRFEQGWEGYEHRVGLPQYDTWSFPHPPWDGSSLGDRTLLIHCEQGLGDTLQFIRYVRAARERTANVILASRSELLPLLRQSGYEPVVSRDELLPPFDVQVALMSLPRILRTMIGDMPRDVPYLAADPRLVETWRERLASGGDFKIGIQWQGNPIYVGDTFRSIPLAEFLPLTEVRGATFFSLQKGFGSEQLAGLARPMPIHDLSGELDLNSGAFMDTAAVMQNLDLVITSDTAAAHLAGALGVTVWVALPRFAEWRWFLDREDSPWYPTMRLFRQAAQGDWSDVFRRLAVELKKLVSNR